MSELMNYLDEITDIAANPRKAVEQYIQQTGNSVIGCLPPYTPEEIVHAAGMLPVGLWGGHVELSKVRAVLPPYACSIMQSIKELELSGAYNMLSGVIVPSVCDTLKAMGQKWSVEAIPCIQFVHPHNRKLASAKLFLQKEYEHVKAGIETITGKRITEAALHQSIQVYNEHRQTMRAFSEMAANYPRTISPKVRHAIYKSAFFMPKEAHTAIIEQIMAELAALPEENKPGINVIVSGIMLEPDWMLDLFADLDINITGDDLAQESRQYRVDVPEGEDALERLSGWWQLLYGCSLAYEYEKSRIPMLVEMKNERNADAVIVAMMKFCDPEEFDYPIIKRMLEDEGIPLIQIEVDQESRSAEQIRTRLQSFVEMIGSTV